MCTYLKFNVYLMKFSLKWYFYCDAKNNIATLLFINTIIKAVISVHILNNAKRPEYCRRKGV